MKEYKAKIKDTGKWVKGVLFQQFVKDSIWCIGTKPFCPNDCSVIIGKNKDWFENDPTTICEPCFVYEGTTYWENDIIKVCIEHDDFHRTSKTGIIERSNSYLPELKIGTDEDRPIYDDFFSICRLVDCPIDIQLLGNTFDNPKLARTIYES